MEKGFLASLCIIFTILFVPLGAQEDTSIVLHHDTIETTNTRLVYIDTLSTNQVKQLQELKIVETFQPNPTRAVIYSAIFPGLGQIYNRKYWKLPIIYGGFLGVVYAITWNGNMYQDYKNAYMDITLDAANRDRWHHMVSIDPQQIIDDPNKRQMYEERFKRRKDYFRRNRDLAIIVGVGLYTLSMIDAYVDAQLYNFSVTPDLSMTMAPVIWGPTNGSSSMSVGFQCNITF